jgi:hypothetical protein
VVAALHALEESDITNAGNEIRWIVASSRERGSDV